LSSAIHNPHHAAFFFNVGFGSPAGGNHTLPQSEPQPNGVYDWHSIINVLSGGYVIERAMIGAGNLGG
jgi:hypothetical protein